MDIDVGAIWQIGPNKGKSRMFSLGFLLQNVGEGKLIKAENGKAPHMVRNFRPGLSVKPDEKTVLSAELYDALGATKGERNDVSRNIRVGAERWITNYCALRAGVYHINNSAMRAYTGGIGIKLPKVMNIYPEIDLTVMHWDSSNNNTGFGGITFRF